MPATNMWSEEGLISSTAFSYWESLLSVTSLCVAKLLRRKVRQRCIILSCVFHRNFFIAALKGQ
jgi:hypothetical protein